MIWFIDVEKDDIVYMVKLEPLSWYGDAHKVCRVERWFYMRSPWYCAGTLVLIRSPSLRDNAS